MAWINSDGLAVRIAKDEALEGNRGGVNSRGGPQNVLDIKIIATELTLTSNVINEAMINLPRQARIEKIELLVETAFTSAGAATLNIGTQTLARGAQSPTGLVNGQTVASLTAGALITLVTGSGTAGALVGTTLAAPGLIVANAGTAVFTAGRAMVRVYYYMPLV